MTGMARFNRSDPPGQRSGVHAVLDAADQQTAELERLRDENAELRCRVEELNLELDDNAVERIRLHSRIERLTTERDDWRTKALSHAAAEEA